MKKHNLNQAPQVTFTSIAKEQKMLIYFGLYDDDVLLNDMYRAADNENYDMAIVFRDELIRRGKIQTM